MLIALLMFAFMPARPSSAEEANAFVYHRFNDSRYPSTNIATDHFIAQMELLKNEAYSVLPLGQVVGMLKAGESLPERCAVITIDDAYSSFLSDGWPILKRYGYPATLFVGTETVGATDFLSWQELRELQQDGVEIGNHSARHSFLLDRLPGEDDLAWTARVAADLALSQDMFEQKLGAAPRLFAYPYGEFSPDLIDLVKAAGFDAAFGQQSGVIDDRQDLFSLPRFPVGGPYVQIDEFRSKLFMKALPLQVVAPRTTIVGDKEIPVLRFKLTSGIVNKSSLSCFVPGQSGCRVRMIDESEGLYEVRALQALTGRRSKYTVTATDESAKSWYWFSQLWVQPRGGVVADELVPR